MGDPLKGADGLTMTRTPLRISFAGGGTDLPGFYSQGHGAVLSTTIDKYVHVQVKRHSELFFEPIRINYSRSEQVDRIEEIENNIARACLTLLEIEPPIYVSTVGDVPASTGLGGSSAFCVGLLNALHAYRGERVSPGQLAAEACQVELELLGEPIGKQDQYAAAYGGLNLFTFRSDEGVTVEHKWKAAIEPHELMESILLFWTGHQRDASGVLSEQKENIDDRLDRLVKMRDQAHELESLLGAPTLDLAAFGKVLDEGWRLKRGLASRITNPQIDNWYSAALDAGACGGKLCGAGGGGFLMFVVPPERRETVRLALHGLNEMPVHYESYGSQLVIPFNL